MKQTPLFLILLLMTLSSQADDTEEVKKAFATFQEYQKTDDIRSLDLFATNCTATFILVSPTMSATNTWSGDKFRAELSRQLSLKQGNRDSYEEVTVTEMDNSLALKCKVRFASSGKTGSLLMRYVRDPDGVFRIHKMTVTVPIDASGPQGSSATDGGNPQSPAQFSSRACWTVHVLDYTSHPFGAPSLRSTYQS